MARRALCRPAPSPIAGGLSYFNGSWSIAVEQPNEHSVPGQQMLVGVCDFSMSGTGHLLQLSRRPEGAADRCRWRPGERPGRRSMIDRQAAHPDIVERLCKCVATPNASWTVILLPNALTSCRAPMAACCEFDGPRGRREILACRQRSRQSQSIRGVRNPDYYDKGLPYLDGFVGIFADKQATRVDAIRADRASIEFRSMPPSARDELVGALGDKITVQEGDWDVASAVTPNHKKKPFDDVRVRRALTLAIDRWGGAPGHLQDRHRAYGRRHGLSRVAPGGDQGGAGSRSPGTGPTSRSRGPRRGGCSRRPGPRGSPSSSSTAMSTSRSNMSPPG